MAAILTVRTPDKETFNTYFYGYGYVRNQIETDDFGKVMIETTVDYGEDWYRAEYQAGRFWSGLYFAEVREG